MHRIVKDPESVVSLLGHELNIKARASGERNRAPTRNLFLDVTRLDLAIVFLGKGLLVTNEPRLPTAGHFAARTSHQFRPSYASEINLDQESGTGNQKIHKPL